MNTSLAFTLSPPYRFTNGTKLKNPNRHLYDEDRISIKSILRYIRCGTYIIYPEITNTGRLHYHGIINLDKNQNVRFHKYAFYKLKLLGMVDIKVLNTFKDRLRWIIYMTKEWGYTQELLEISRPMMRNPELLNKNKSRLLSINEESVERSAIICEQL